VSDCYWWSLSVCQCLHNNTVCVNISWLLRPISLLSVSSKFLCNCRVIVSVLAVHVSSVCQRWCCSFSLSCRAECRGQVTVTCITQQAASRVMWSTCCIIIMPPNEAHSPVFAGQPMVKARQVCVGWLTGNALYHVFISGIVSLSVLFSAWLNRAA